MSEAVETIPAPSQRRKRRPATLIKLFIVGCAIGGAAGWWHYASLTPKRFAAVDEGRLYRSGEVTPAQLERMQKDLGLKTVLSLLNPDAPESVAEHEAADRLGLTWINIPLTGDGASTPADRDRIRAAIFDTTNEPMLVHCAAGTNRTGLAVGMYRLHHDGWTLDQVLDEMRRFGFEDEPHHQNLRGALAEEARAAAAEHD